VVRERVMHDDSIHVYPETQHDEAMRALAGADLFVFPSYAEGFGIVALEAAALGVPIVATNVGAVSEILDTGGILVAPRDVASLTKALLDGMTRIQDLTQEAQLIRARVTATYSIHAVGQELFELWDSLATARHT